MSPGQTVNRAGKQRIQQRKWKSVICDKALFLLPNHPVAVGLVTDTAKKKKNNPFFSAFDVIQYKHNIYVSALKWLKSIIF